MSDVNASPVDAPVEGQAAPAAVEAPVVETGNDAAAAPAAVEAVAPAVPAETPTSGLPALDPALLNGSGEPAQGSIVASLMAKSAAVLHAFEHLSVGTAHLLAQELHDHIASFEHVI